jgi:amino acid transporter
MGDKSSSLFLRTATGLVKPWAVKDGFMYNFYAVTPLCLGYLFIVNGLGLSQGNMALALLIALFFCAFLAFQEASLISTMPRSGGDYVYQTRILGGALGYIDSWAMMGANQIISMGVLVGWMCAELALAPFLALFGAMYQMPALVDAAGWISSTTGILVLSALGVIFCGVINLVGMTWYRRAQRFCFVIGAVGMAIVAVLLVWTTVGGGGFPAAFNDVTANTFGKDPNSYSLLLSKAKELGWTGTAPPIDSFVMSIPAFYGFMGASWSAYNAGEIKNAASLRNQLYQTLGAAVSAGVILIVLYLAISGITGEEWYKAASWLYWNHVGDYRAIAGPISPYGAYIFAILLAKLGAVPLIILFVAVNAWFWMIAPNVVLAASRWMLAMSFDRMFPQVFGRVNLRFRSPHVAILLCCALGLLWGWLNGYPEISRLYATLSLMGILFYAASGVAVIALPLWRKQLWGASPARRWRVGGIPLVSICGAVFILYAAICAWLFLTDTRLFSIQNNPYAVGFFFGTYISGIVAYLAFKAYRRRQGIPVEKLYSEIPVE